MLEVRRKVTLAVLLLIVKGVTLSEAPLPAFTMLSIATESPLFKLPANEVMLMAIA